MRSVVFLLALLALPCFSAEPPQPTSKVETPSELEGLVWNKWDTPNFIVISLDKGQGSSMRGEAESVRDSVLDRWTLKASKRECKLVCVSDAVMLKRLFGLSDPKCEVKASGSGLAEAAIWIDMDRKDLLPSLIAEVELLSGEYRPFASKGIPALERSPSFVRDLILSAPEAPLASLVATSEKADAGNSAILCLLVRKEFGSRAFGGCVRSSSPPIGESLGFSSEGEFLATLARYRANLSADLKSGRTPDGYLSVRP